MILTVTAPAIHPNGSSVEGLKNPLMDTYAALEEAADKLKKAAPNQRDYYSHAAADEHWKAARVQHMRRIQIIRDLQAEIEFEMDMIDNRKVEDTLRLPRYPAS